MGVTRRYWGEAGLVGLLTGLAVVFAEPLFLVGSAGVGGWLLARQYAFVRTASKIAEDLSVTQSPDRDAVMVGDTVTVTLTAELERPAPMALGIEVESPVGVEPVGVEADRGEGTNDAEQTVTLPAGERTATATFEVRCPLAGEFEFRRPTVTAETERFRTAFPSGVSPSIVVEPRTPQNLHIGAGGETRSSPFGETNSDERGPGLDLAGIRQYVPGDTMQQIDWNATARFDQPHVREFEKHTKHGTAILLDRRPSMGTGPDGGTKFDYARQVALGIVGRARRDNEPVRVYEVGEGGLLARHGPTTTTQEYALLERRLRKIGPQESASGNGSATAAEGSAEATKSPSTVRRQGQRLLDDSAFGNRLRPFFEERDAYAERIADDPLYGAAKLHLSEANETMTTAVLTDDADPVETREVVKFVRRHSNHVLAFLTPTVLFEDGEAMDPETDYERYVDFERFRRRLAGIGRVSAFEVGPGDELESLLAGADANRLRRGVAEGDD